MADVRIRAVQETRDVVLFITEKGGWDGSLPRENLKKGSKKTSKANGK